ncbi:MAG: hypothetical protein GC182_23245 [Rhodopseudomonas sp.]|nr:hypothetical protein [Rhodopseudomonas sp.]
MTDCNPIPHAQTPAWLNKVPEVTLIFWLVKMMSTTVGETAADYLNADLHFGLTATSIVTGVLLAGALALQLRASRYIPSLYWLVVLLVSVFGTLITDNLTDKLDVPLALSTGVFGLALLATFAIWYARERTLSIQSIDTPTRETFYWIAILFTFALGTAAGDWIAESLGLGFAFSALLFGGLIAATAFARFALRADSVICFWVAYVLTRPLGASCGDLLSQSTDNGGLGLGTTGTSALFLAVIVGLVAYLSAAQTRLPAAS